MRAATESVELTRLRARVDGLVQRRLSALERLAPLPGAPSRRRLDAMRFELSELEQQLAELEAMTRA